jgi:hypothetical protein
MMKILRQLEDEKDRDKLNVLLNEAVDIVRSNPATKAKLLSIAMDVEVLNTAVRLAATMYSSSIERSKDDPIFHALKELAEKETGRTIEADPHPMLKAFLADHHATPFIIAVMSVLLTMIEDDPDGDVPNTKQKKITDLLG